MDYLYGKLCKYVEEKSYTLPVANSNTLGGIKADPRTENDTQEVHIGSNGKLYINQPDYKLPIASHEELGGIKIGENLTITEDGILSAQRIEPDFEKIHLASPIESNFGGRIDFGDIDRSTGKGYCYIEETEDDVLTIYADSELVLKHVVYPSEYSDAATKGYADSKMPKNIIYNVKDYDATGDGIVSDSYAIQNALNACNRAGGGTVYFPKGTYLLTTPVKFYSNQYLLGEIGATLLQANEMTDNKVTPANYACNLMRNYNNGGNGYTVTHDVVIDGLTFDGGTQEEKVTALLAFCHTQNITIKNCKFTNGFSNTTVGNGHDIEVNSSKNVLILNCVHYGNRRTNYNSELIQIDTFRLQLMYPWLPDSGENNNKDSTACDNVRIYGCEFYGSNILNTSGNSAIGNHDNGSNDISIKNCKFSGCYIGVKPRKCTNQIVSNNLFVNCLFGIYIYALEESKDCIVFANTFVGCTYAYLSEVNSSNPAGFNNYVNGVLCERLTSLENANDITVPTTLAVKTYVDNAIAAAISDIESTINTISDMTTE